MKTLYQCYILSAILLNCLIYECEGLARVDNSNWSQRRPNATAHNSWQHNAPTSNVRQPAWNAPTPANNWARPNQTTGYNNTYQHTGWGAAPPHGTPSNVNAWNSSRVGQQYPAAYPTGNQTSYSPYAPSGVPTGSGHNSWTNSQPYPYGVNSYNSTAGRGGGFQTLSPSQPSQPYQGYGNAQNSSGHNNWFNAPTNPYNVNPQNLTAGSGSLYPTLQPSQPYQPHQGIGTGQNSGSGSAFPTLHPSQPNQPHQGFGTGQNSGGGSAFQTLQPSQPNQPHQGFGTGQNSGGGAAFAPLQPSQPNQPHQGFGTGQNSGGGAALSPLQPSQPNQGFGAGWPQGHTASNGNNNAWNGGNTPAAYGSVPLAPVAPAWNGAGHSDLSYGYGQTQPAGNNFQKPNANPYATLFN